MVTQKINSCYLNCDLLARDPIVMTQTTAPPYPTRYAFHAIVEDADKIIWYISPPKDEMNEYDIVLVDSILASRFARLSEKSKGTYDHVQIIRFKVFGKEYLDDEGTDVDEELAKQDKNIFPEGTLLECAGKLSGGWKIIGEAFGGKRAMTIAKLKSDMMLLTQLSKDNHLTIYEINNFY